MIHAVILSAILMLIVTIPITYAETDEKTEFASYLEETLGHFWALEQNLDDGNAELALVHATHPVAELYDLMKPQLQQTDPSLDLQVQATLMELRQKATTDVSRAQAQEAIDEAKNIIEIARQTIVGTELSEGTNFKLALMKGLLETSIAEYSEAVSNGVIEEMAEFQDGSAFVWRSQQIFDTIKSDIDSHEAEEIEEFYDDLWAAYDRRADPSEVGTLAGGIIHEIDEVLGIEGEEEDLLGYVDNIRSLLEQTKQEYSQGNTDVALSLATKAYLDNFEFLETPLAELGEEELMEEVEHLMREELRDMIKNGAPSSEVNAHIDTILEKMDTVAVVVPEFGTIAIIILATAIISIIALSTKSRVTLRI